MGKKAKLKAIKRLAANLPVINNQTHEVHLLKGSEILEWNTITEIDGKKIEPDVVYRVPMPVNIIQNNARRIKRAYVKNGVKGIGHLLSSINHLREENYKTALQ